MAGEVNSTLETEKYIIHSSRVQEFKKPIATRAAWLATFFLSGVAIVPLTGKLILNLIDGIVDPAARKAALGNLLGITVAFPITLLLSGVSIIFPSWVGGRFARGIVLPIIPLYTLNIAKLQKKCQEFPKEYAHKVKGLNGIEIDSADIPLENKDEKVQRYRIVFNAAAEMYQIGLDQYKRENAKLQCSTRVFNYPGITENNPPDSSVDFVNAGIAEVYDLAKKMNWTNAELEKNLHLYGYCFGGSIAVQVAAYFKDKHGVDLLVFMDRAYSSYSAAMAGMLHSKLGVPLNLANVIATTFLYAGGDLDVDSIQAIKKCNPNCIHYLNVNTEKSHGTETVMEQMKHALGIGAMEHGDGILLPDVTVVKTLEREKVPYSQETKAILTALEMKGPWVYAPEGMGHFGSMANLTLDAERRQGRAALDYYKKVVEVHDENLTRKSSMPGLSS